MEKSLADAERKEINSLVELISSELIKIYNKRAQDYEKAENEGIQQALIYYEKCLDVIKLTISFYYYIFSFILDIMVF